MISLLLTFHSPKMAHGCVSHQVACFHASVDIIRVKLEKTERLDSEHRKEKIWEMKVSSSHICIIKD